MNSKSSVGAPGAGGSDSSATSSFPKINGPLAASEGLALTPSSAAYEPASKVSYGMLASLDSFRASPSTSGA
jgi:hypothetical protein